MWVQQLQTQFAIPPIPAVSGCDHRSGRDTPRPVGARCSKTVKLAESLETETGSNRQFSFIRLIQTTVFSSLNRLAPFFITQRE